MFDRCTIKECQEFRRMMASAMRKLRRRATGRDDGTFRTMPGALELELAELVKESFR